MNETIRVDLDTETPVNPYSLLEAVNRSSRSSNRAWLIYIGLMGYLLIAVAGVTHRDLLLGADVQLPILGVKIDLTRFFLAAPILLLIIHIGAICQLVLLARKALEFGSAVRLLEATDQRSHPLRLELDNFFFVQALAGPDRSPIVSFFLNAISWLTLVVMPVMLLAYVQLTFLPYHDPFITSVHRIVLLADIALVVLLGVFLLHAETSFLRAILHTTLYHPVGFLLTAGLLATVAGGSLFLATIPGEPADRYAVSYSRQVEGGAQSTILSTVVPMGTEPMFGLFHRNLVVIGTDLVPDKDVTPGEPSLNLRGRDLRFARLDRADLHQADLTGANLDGASLVGTDLRGAWMGCADLGELQPADSRRATGCMSARGANLAKARLNEARLAGADLTGARLDGAQAEGAQLAQTRLPGAALSGAKLDRADLTGAELFGANLQMASMQGADLTGAKLAMADLAGALLQGASLSQASLEGTTLREAEIEGATFASARLIGADLTGARMQGTDLTRTLVWRTTAPGGENSAFADMAQISIQPPGPTEIAAMKASIDRVDEGPLRNRLSEGLGPLMDATRNAGWSASPDQQLWQGFLTATDPAGADGYKSRITDYLVRLMCRSRFANGAVATGVARRAMASGFKGDLPAIHDRLRAADCPASFAMPTRFMREVAIAADAARRQ
jgi:uncharacterized protein YjbI with pentapeptide repeats